jgi:DNA-binding CsgD family transcriptional regulator
MKKKTSMTTALSLERAAQSIRAFLREHTKENPQTRETVLSFMQGVQRIFPQWVLATCPVMHPELRFVTENCEAVFGYPLSHFTGPGNGAQTIASYIHEDDIDDVLKCFDYLNNFLKNCLPEEFPLLRCAFHYRFHHRKGNIITMRDEKAVMQIDDEASLYYSILKDTTSELVFTGVRLEIFKQEEMALEKIVDYRPSAERSKLSKRENELVGLIQRGLTTKEIAYQLHISHHTVRNIRQKMFEKYKVNNAIELLNKAL